jgi:predicted small lipoprotein YifL
MKKVIAIFAIAALTACGGKGASTETTDSTAVAVDSTATTTDSTSVAADTTATK